MTKEPTSAATRAAERIMAVEYITAPDLIRRRYAQWIDAEFAPLLQAADALAKAAERMAYWAKPVRGEFVSGAAGDEAFATCKCYFEEQCAALAAYRERRGV